MTDELTTQREALKAEQESMRALAVTRPTVSVANLIRQSPAAIEAYRAKVKVDAEAWDAAHPGVFARWEEVANLIEANDRAYREKREAEALTAYVLSPLDEVPRIKASVVTGLEDTQSWDIVREWGKAGRDKSWCLLLLGGVGSGKSTAAGAFVVEFGRELAKHKHFGPNMDAWRPRWVRAVEASRMSSFGAEAEARFREWRECALLVIDDMGTELMTPTWQQALDDVLDYRYQHSLQTLMPSNLTADEFKARYGARISDRIREDGMVRTVDTKSMRRKRAS